MANDIEEVREIVTRSGNSFHCKVIQYLKANNWNTLVSPYYNDNLSGKPREIDLIAEKLFIIPDKYGQNTGHVNVRLFIECKYIPQKTVFWFHDKDQDKSQKLVEKTTPCKLDNSYTKDHHYLLDPRVAKLFADEKSKAADNETFFKALTQGLNSMIYYRGKKYVATTPPKYDYTKFILNYPVIICNSFDNLYAVNIDNDNDPVAIKDNFQLEVNYAYTDQKASNLNEYFLLDIISFQLLDTFFESIKKDADLAGFFLSYG